MAYTPPPTKNPGDLITASEWNTSVRDNALALAVWQDWAPVLTAPTPPSLGSTGTATGRYVRFGKTILWRAVFRASGSGVAPGVGNWQISLPAPATSGQVGGGWYWLVGSPPVILCAVDSNGFMISPSGPVAAPTGWQTGAALTLSGTYEAA